MTAVVLRFGKSAHDARVLAEARDLDTGELLTFGSLREMDLWLKWQGYRWRFGSSGIWERAA